MSDVTSRPREVTSQEITECVRERIRRHELLVLYSTILSLALNYDIHVYV